MAEYTVGGNPPLAILPAFGAVLKAIKAARKIGVPLSERAFRATVFVVYGFAQTFNKLIPHQGPRPYTREEAYAALRDLIGADAANVVLNAVEGGAGKPGDLGMLPMWTVDP